MITNERQYEQTRKQLTLLASLLASTEAGTAGNDGFRDLQAAGLASQIQDLRDELTEYEQRRAGSEDPPVFQPMDAHPSGSPKSST